MIVAILSSFQSITIIITTISNVNIFGTIKQCITVYECGDFSKPPCMVSCEYAA